ncbi:phage minor head protein [Streptomyces sp. cg35]|uniref:phage minor head protein n=1 Tax=Streptomyces sp. cg35 TaxID=3421650 RepID=UPI003D1650A5
MSLAQLVSRAVGAFRTRLAGWLATAREAVTRRGLDGWPDTWPAEVPPSLAPFIVEAYMNGAGGLAAAHPRAEQYARAAVERIAAGHWPANTYRKLAGLPPEQQDTVFDPATHEAWANALVQTELRSAMNAGTLTAALLNGADTGTRMLKTWRIHMPLDGRTRDAHQQANGQTVPIDQPFTVGGERLMFPGDPTSASPAQTWNCRCTLRLTPAPLTASGGTMPQPTPVAVPAPGPDDIRWSGPLAPIEQNSGDMRRLAATQRLDTRELPLPLLFQPSLAERHQGAVQGLAILRNAWVEGGVLHGSGTFDGRDPDATKVADKIQRGYLGWVSVDLDKALMELDESNPDEPVEVVRSWRLTGATLVGQPAFDKHAKIRILDDDEDLPIGPLMQDPAAPDERDPLAADAPLDDPSVPELDPATVEDQDPAAEGETPAAKKVPPRPVPKDKPADNDADNDAPEQGAKKPPFPPKPQAGKGANKDTDEDNGKDKKKAKGKPFALDAATLQRASLVASVIPLAPPKAWFADPGFDQPTAMHVTPEGQVFGHLATWDRPHMSFAGRNIFAPKSPTGYQEFHVGSVLTAEGTYLSVGTLTAGTSHAEHGLTASETMAFYSDTGYGAAVVRAGEDAHGIWVAGSLAPEATPEQIAALRRAPLSGDWRDNGHGLDLVAALAVNRPAFPVLRASAYCQDDKALSLVAAGVVSEADAFGDWPDVPQQAIPGSGEWAAALNQAIAPMRKALEDIRALMPIAAQRAGQSAHAQREDFARSDEQPQQLSLVTKRMNAVRTAGVEARMAKLRQPSLSTGTRIGVDAREKDMDDADDAEGELSPDEQGDITGEFDDDDLAEAEAFLNGGGDGGQAFKRKNWVEKAGGLPRYIKRVAKHIRRGGATESHAIAGAVNQIKRWARGGGNVKPDTVAKAQAALAEWNAKRLLGRRK